MQKPLAARSKLEHTWFHNLGHEMPEKQRINFLLHFAQKKGIHIYTNTYLTYLLTLLFVLVRALFYLGGFFADIKLKFDLTKSIDGSMNLQQL